MRGLVENAVSVLDQKKPAAELAPVSAIEEGAQRSALVRNRTYGDLDIEQVKPDPNQVRRVDTESDSFKELLASVREHGVLEPITVRWLEDLQRYQVITGERRYQASVRAGLKTIPAIVRDVDDTTKAVHQLVENIQREGMNPIEEARAFRRYLAATGHSQEQLAKRIGKSKSYVSRMIGILEDLTRAEQAELEKVAGPQLPGKSLLFEAVRIKDPKVRLSVIRGQMTWDEAREAKRQEAPSAPRRPRGFGRRYVLRQHNAIVTVTFKKSTASEDEIGEALAEASKEHRREARHEVP